MRLPSCMQAQAAINKEEISVVTSAARQRKPTSTWQLLHRVQSDVMVLGMYGNLMSYGAAVLPRFEQP